MGTLMKVMIELRSSARLEINGRPDSHDDHVDFDDVDDPPRILLEYFPIFSNSKCWIRYILMNTITIIVMMTAMLMMMTCCCWWWRWQWWRWQWWRWQWWWRPARRGRRWQGGRLLPKYQALLVPPSRRSIWIDDDEDDYDETSSQASKLC